MPGVVRTTSGYAGGTARNPDYRNMGDHSETVRVEFDPQRISYDELLAVFWESHDPSSVAYSRQYRNAVFAVGKSQQISAERTKQQLAVTLGRPVNTAIEPAGTFYAAEDYHQKYLLRRAGDIFNAFRPLFTDDNAFAASTAAARLNGYLGCNGEPDNLASELTRLGLSPQMQKHLVAYVATTCRRFKGLTCPAPQ